MADPTPLTAEEEWEALTVALIGVAGFDGLPDGQRALRRHVERHRPRIEAATIDAERKRYRRLEEATARFLIDLGYGVDFNGGSTLPPREMLEAMVRLGDEDESLGFGGDAYFILSSELGDWRAALSPEEEGTAVRRLPPPDPSIVTTTRE